MKNYQALNAKNWLKIYAAIRLVLSDRVTYIYLFIHTWFNLDDCFIGVRSITCKAGTSSELVGLVFHARLKQ